MCHRTRRLRAAGGYGTAGGRCKGKGDGARGFTREAVLSLRKRCTASCASARAGRIGRIRCSPDRRAHPFGSASRGLHAEPATVRFPCPSSQRIADFRMTPVHANVDAS